MMNFSYHLSEHNLNDAKYTFQLAKHYSVFGKKDLCDWIMFSLNTSFHAADLFVILHRSKPHVEFCDIPKSALTIMYRNRLANKNDRHNPMSAITREYSRFFNPFKIGLCI